MKVWIEKKLVKGRDDRIQGEPILGKALWSATESSSGVDIYKLMREINPDDVVLHFTDKEGITGISRAASKYSKVDGKEHSSWNWPAFKVPLREYQELAPPVTKDELLSEENRELLDSIRENNKVFYSKNLSLNQGTYITESPLELTRLINSIYSAKAGQDLPYIQDILHSTNGYAESDKWEELKAAVKKINNREALEKFFDAAGHVLNKLELSSEDLVVYAAALTKPNRIQLTIGGRYVTNIQRQGKTVVLGYYVPTKEVQRLRRKYPKLSIGNMEGGSKELPLQWIALEAGHVDVDDLLEAILAPAKESKQVQKVSQFRT